MGGDYEELLRSREVVKIFNISVKALWEWRGEGSARLLGFQQASSAIQGARSRGCGGS
jgi:hypothetical protein